jgi:hypothetical protein
MEAQRGRRILVFEASDAPAALKALLATRDFSSMDHLVIAGADKNGPVAKDIKAQSFYTKLVYNEKVLDELAGRRLEPRFSAVFAPASKPDKTPVNMFPIVNKQPLGGFKEPTPQTGGSIIKTPGSPGIMLVPGRDTKLLKEQQTGPPVPVTSGKINGEVVTTKFGPRDKYTIKLIPMPEKPDPTKKPLISTITKSFGEMDRFLDKIRLKQGRGQGRIRKIFRGTLGDEAADFTFNVFARPGSNERKTGMEIRADAEGFGR